MKKTILVIDDDEEICEEVSEILKDEGYEVTSSFDGLEGDRLAGSNHFDLILLDLKMSGMTGLDILRHLKEKKEDAKVIVITGSLAVDRMLKQKKVLLEDKDSQILKQADSVITKPFDIEAVLVKIKELIG